MGVYTDFAAFYDLINNRKDYQGETAYLAQVIEQHAARSAETLLDAACGTGGHLVHLAKKYACVGVDISEHMLALAREKLPDMPMYQGDMCTFDMRNTFDVVTCLFSAIGYMQSAEHLRQAVYTMGRHVTPGGLLIVEPWLRPGEFYEGYLAMDGVNQPDIKLSRVSISHIQGDRSLMEFHYLVATREEGVRYFTETHDMGLFSHELYLEAFRAAGLHPVYDERGLIGRGLYIGLKGVQDMSV